MSTRPGVAVRISGVSPRNNTPPTNTGTAFFAGITTKGRTDTAVLCSNMDDYTRNFGPRDTGGPLYDSAAAAFKKGVTSLWVGRFAGPAATKATRTFNDSAAGASVAVDAIGPGVSTLTAQIIAGTVGGTVQVVIADTATGLVVEQSTNAAVVNDLVQWGTNVAQQVRIRALGANLPVVAAAASLAGGADDRASLTDTLRVAALATLFPKTLGPGQVAIPGATTAAAQVGLANHAQDNNRFALWDGPDTATASTAVAAMVALQGGAGLEALGETFGIMCSPWRVVPGPSQGTTVTIPPCGIIAGLMASSDGRTNNPNAPAAGANGIDDYSLGSSQAEWSDADRQTLNNAGVAVFKSVYGEQRLYGYRTGATNTSDASYAWLSAGAARLRMALANDLDILGEEFVFNEIDGNGHLIAAFNGAISGLLQTYWSLGALFGQTASDAFVVDTGSTVNTPTTLQNNELHAKVGIKVSPFAEMVFIDVTKVALTEGF